MSSEELVKSYQQLAPEAQKEVDELLEKLISQGSSESGKTPTPLFGRLKGKITMAADFDAPMDDFKP